MRVMGSRGWDAARRRTGVDGRVVAVPSVVFMWCALWRDVSVANVASGLLVALVIVLGRPPVAPRRRIRPVAALGFVALVAWDLIRSTATVVAEILTPTDRTSERLLPVHLAAEHAHVQHLVLVAVTLTPGTAVVESDTTSRMLLLHLLHGTRAPATAAHVSRLARRAAAAFPAPEES